MRRREIKLGLILLLSVSLQSTLLARLNLFNTVPDLILILAICYGLLYGPVQGLFLGLVGGLILDLAGGGILGIHTLTKALVGYGAGFLEKTVFKENIAVPVIAVVTATLGCELVSYLVLTAFHWQIGFVSYLLYTILPLCLYHFILTIPVYNILLKILPDPRFISKGRIHA